ncbi:MAG TPA: FAD binding domain-containing protein [Rectinemataceae bacterium]|nr:FAD binding domain-containing protein [Rectinemataceae bacterium]
MLHEFDYASPSSREELHELLARHGKSAKLLAGGTDLLVNIRAGLSRPALVIDVKKVREFKGITWSAAEGLVIRPAVTINEVLADKVVKERFPLLAECAHDLASYQIRNRATVIGNVVNASPCSDMAPALLCLGAKAVISSKRGEREIPFSQFFKGVKKTVLAEDELLERIVVPASSSGARGAYRKLKRINGHDLGIVGVALMRKDDRVSLGISSSAPTPVLVEGLGEGDEEAKVVAAARAAISPISDVRCSKEYREFMVETYVRRLLAEVK